MLIVGRGKWWMREDAGRIEENYFQCAKSGRTESAMLLIKSGAQVQNMFPLFPFQ